MNEIHEANRIGWDAVSPHWQKRVDSRKNWRRYHLDPGLALNAQELKLLKDISGKNVCVLGSGDNLIVFAISGLGARVTSVDISQMQLNIAAEKAHELGLDVAFVRADVTYLSIIEDENFDVVYTGGHVGIWVSNLQKYYSEAARILKKRGLLIVNEYHPFRRLWKELPDKLEMKFGYFDLGPHVYDRSEEVPGKKPGSLPSYEFHWTVSNYAMAVIHAGCKLVLVEETESQIKWEIVPMEGLPSSLLIVGEKE